MPALMDMEEKSIVETSLNTDLLHAKFSIPEDFHPIIFIIAKDLPR